MWWFRPWWKTVIQAFLTKYILLLLFSWKEEDSGFFPTNASTPERLEVKNVHHLTPSKLDNEPSTKRLHTSESPTNATSKFDSFMYCVSFYYHFMIIMKCYVIIRHVEWHHIWLGMGISFNLHPHFFLTVLIYTISKGSQNHPPPLGYVPDNYANCQLVDLIKGLIYFDGLWICYWESYPLQVIKYF